MGAGCARRNRREEKSAVFMRVRRGSVEACGKGNLVCEGVLTNWEHMLILVSSLQATLLDRGVEQTLFDN